MMDNQLNLMSYFPPYLQEFAPLNEIVKAEEISINPIKTEIKQLLNNQFITTCDERGISYFERILNITPIKSDDLQTRILRVILKWNDFPPYTINYMISVLNNLFGEENYEFIDNLNEYSFNIRFLNNTLPNIPVLNEFIHNIKPANLVYSITAKNQNNLDTFTGLKLVGNYKKSSISFENFHNEIDIFSNVSTASNYIKEVINIE